MRMQRETYTDDHGVTRYVDSGRKVRSDKGTRKPHPRHCRHCVMVETYREARQAQLDAIDYRGGWRDERARDRLWTFRAWLTVYRYEQPDHGHAVAA